MWNKLGLSCAKLRASLNLFGFIRSLFTFIDLTYFEFANLAYELNFGALLLLLWKVWFGTFCSVWNTWFCRFGLVDLAFFSLIEVLFISKAVFIFEFVFIIQVIYMFKIVFLFKVVLQLGVSIILNFISIFEVIYVWISPALTKICTLFENCYLGFTFIFFLRKKLSEIFYVYYLRVYGIRFYI